MAQYNWLQVQSSQQYLNILNNSNAADAVACQGSTPYTDNYLWLISPPDGTGYCTLQEKSSGMYVCLNNAGAVVQEPLPASPTSAPANFLWQIIPAANKCFNIQLKSNGMYLGIVNANGGVGSPAGLGNTPAASNFLWAKQLVIQVIVANKKGSATPADAVVMPGDTIVWTITGASWPSAATNGISFPNLLTLFPAGLSYVAYNSAIQGTLATNFLPSYYNVPYPYTVNPTSSGALDDVMPLEFADENGLSFDPQIKIKMPVKP